ncbi:MAG: glycosyltransferase family 4 protein [Undibacterium sp.]|nr:glycosyltransferase family 4 protein [Opitutaceae bacterium]
MRFVFINRFYWPDEPATAQLLGDLAEALVAAGHVVTVIASHPGGATPADENRRGVRIRRVRGTRLSKHGFLGKIADFATFYLGALLRLFTHARPGDIAVALTDPPLIGIGVWFVARLRGALVVHWIQDIYPEIAITLTGHRWLTFLRPLRNLAWRRAEACVTIGTDMAGAVRTAGVKAHRLTLIPNWAPAGLLPQPASAADSLRATWGLTGKFVVLYSGNLGRVHDLEPLLDVAAHLRTHTHIALLFIGSGAQRPALMAAAAERGLSNVHFQPPQPRAELTTSLALGDLHFVTLRPGCETSVFPSKLYGIAAIGRPVLFVGPHDCEIAGLIRRHGFGRTFTRSETTALAATICALSIAPAECAQLTRAAELFATRAGNPTGAAQHWAALAVALDVA